MKSGNRRKVPKERSKRREAVRRASRRERTIREEDFPVVFDGDALLDREEVEEAKGMPSVFKRFDVITKPQGLYVYMVRKAEGDLMWLWVISGGEQVALFAAHTGSGLIIKGYRRRA